MLNRIQRQLDTRALEIAAGNDRIVTQHLEDCEKRYLQTERSIEAARVAAEKGIVELKEALEHSRTSREQSSRELYAFLWKIAGALVLLLLSIIGYLLNKGGLPGAH